LKSLRRAIGAAGITREEWERFTSCLRLDPHASHFAADRMLLFAARYDGVEPWSSLERFARALAPRRLVMLPSGHSTTAVLFRGRIMRETLHFLDDLAASGAFPADAALSAARAEEPA
jgi:hypothetical protein